MAAWGADVRSALLAAQWVTRRACAGVGVPRAVVTDKIWDMGAAIALPQASCAETSCPDQTSA